MAQAGTCADRPQVVLKCLPFWPLTSWLCAPVPVISGTSEARRDGEISIWEVGKGVALSSG